MSMIRIAPEVHLVMDPDTAVVAEERADSVLYSMEPVFERMDKLDLIAEDLLNSLSPSKPLMNSWPGRENTSYMAGIYGNSFYGVVLGLAFSGLLALIIFIQRLIEGGM
ncbi:tetrahydromethanopterin S-methyltransferase subunit B [Methanosarcina sp. 2.H.T.1A.6]|uniref:tetrahydromethanopterin S-methyltransferase subunit B n=1 Tax=unclassified Methanosarcina TaxID=2644672 RepID=UPI00062154F6|nr:MULTISPECIES: tetrahydromethanopterin S-methyltransferase subunit B [unclassified Methanosarcina]KKG11407.1 tetrahydromethanopterin S-methyltransferase subunit B [Methanosarcina sp. 2.H.A.1B.4]KKG14961.1 tetrahydromethanopterin S-methyltransferase subunit B [Methanosarcina sp. 2.H.T.1A.15]KKG16243.1 tetrahydromethanopterin S-methyltransferase subunit B [Methanosarcina sp. 2.H.T.1A.3]KKG23037.1 tetrahydromethanopterin S-methyltransferase subunit B [Methanosarcina sp. 2.H.T.1A.6]KKG26260.1 te